MGKKFSKKLLSLFVALLMVVTTFPVTALSATEEEHDCAVCNGSGTIECTECENGQIDVTCSACGGSGLVTANCDACSATGYLENSCPTCAGTGLDGENQCSDCSGNGVVQIPCDNCNATGLIETTCESCNGNKVVKEDCAVCSATGEVECTTCAGTGKISREYEICPDCDGTGECNMCAGTGVLDQDCSVCNGTKIVDCEDCVAGEVRMACDVCNATGEVTVKKPCATCAATGMLDGVVCPDCNGTKEIESAEECSECENGYVISVCTNCGGAGTIDCSNCENGKEKITCTQCNGTKKCARCSGTGKIYTTQDDSFAFSDPNPQPIEVGDTYQNVATSTNNVSGEIQYSVDDDSIATVSDDGTVTALRVGTVVVTASIATDYTYSSAKVSYNLSIEKGNPEISDIYATEITYGQTLADSTLSAKATLDGKNISGKIEWKNSEIKPKVNDSNKTEYDCVFTPDDQDNYNPVDCKATLKIKQASINPIITPYQGAYDKESHDALEISGILDTDTITYFVDGVQVDSMPTVKDVSDNEKIITVRIERDENYNDFEENYSCLITKIDIDADISANEWTYTGEEQDALTITNNSGEEITSVTYTPKELQDGELSISKDGKVKDAGVYRYEVTLVINNNYNEKVVFPVITTVAQADSELKITNDPEKTYKYEKNQKIQINTEKSALTTADVTYKVDNDEVATISDTGELSILQPGNVTVTASVEETDNCKADEATITITISPGDYIPAFENGDQVTLTYGAQTEYVNALDVDSVKSSGEISYSIEPVNSELVASFDTTTGKIVFADGVQSGSLTVTANIAADEYYNAQEISYKLEVMPLETPDNAYTVDTSIDDNGWIYTSPVQISAAEGYQISKQCSFAAENWSDSITFDTIDGTNEFKFYIRDSSGKITSVITESQNVDCTAPRDLTITFSDTAITKVLEGITFGFYNSKNKKLSVTLKASDATSGLEKFVYCYDGKNDIEIVPDENGECTFTIESEYKGQVKFTAYDKAGNFASFDSKNNKAVQGAINDLTAPEGTVAYSEPANSVGGLRYYSVAPELTFTIDEEYFFSTYELSDETVSTLDKNVGLNITKDGEEYYTGSAVPDEENADLFTAELNEKAKTISVVIPSVLDEKANDGVYAVKLLYSDLSGNSFEIESENFVIDTTVPVVTVSYDNNTVNENAKDDSFFDKARTATITVEEHNFDAESIVAQITAKDIAGEDIETAEAVAMLADLEWNSEGDTHTATIKYSDDAWYTFALTSFKDYALNEMNPDNENKVIYADETVSPEQFVVDKEIAEVEISTEKPLAYKILDGITFGFFSKSTVTITVEDATSGMQKLTYESLKTANSKGDHHGEIAIEEMDSTVINEGYQVSKYEFTIDDEYKDSIEATVLDNSGNESSTQLINEDSDEYNGIIVDTTDPVFSEIAYNAINEVQEENQTKYYYAESAKVVFAVDEEYFYANYYDSAVSANSEENPISALSNDVTLEITKNGDPYYTGSAVPEEEKANLFTAQLNEDAGTITVTIPSVFEGQANDGDFVVTVSYTDLSDHTASVTTDILVIDTTAPVVTLSYDNNTVNENAKDDTFFDKARTATITVEEHNFDAESIDATITAKDIAGEDIEAAEAIEMLANLEWDPEGAEGNTHTATIKYSDDAWYTFELTSFKDYALNEMNPDNNNEVIYGESAVSPDAFVVDKSAPTDVIITYSDEITVIEEVLQKLFWFYNPETANECEVTLTSTDAISGIQYFTYSYNGNAIDVQTENIDDMTVRQETDLVQNDEDKSEFSYTFTIPAEFRGKVTASATDNSGNATSNITESENTIIVDTEAPGLNVDYSTAANTVNGINYYSGDVTVTVTVDEENFMDGEYAAEGIRDMAINADILGDDNETVTKESYQINNWTRDDDTNLWTGTFVLSTEGDYTLSISYADKSGNEVAYTNSDHQITIDKTAPVVTVSYDNNTVNENAKDDSFFDKARTATITVEEHNFNPEIIDATITAKDIAGEDIEAAEAIEMLANLEWDPEGAEGNTHTATIKYSDDAWYTFELTSFKDYALNEMNPDNENKVIYTDETISPEKFVVDTVSPSNDVSYTFTNKYDSSLKKVLNVLTFGVFFNGNIEVKVSAQDMTSGLYIAKLYIKSVSDDADVSNMKITGMGSNGQDNYDEFVLTENDNTKGNTTFTVDASELDEFRGQLYIEIYDKSGNLYRNNSGDTNIVDGKITVNNQVIDNNVNSIDNIEQYESSEYHKETSSIAIRYSNAVKSTVNQASPAKDEAVKLINGKISSLADEDKHMCASNVPLFNTNVPLNISVTDNSSGISTLDIMIFDANEDREIATYKTVIRSDGEIESDTTKKFNSASAGSWDLEQNEYGLTVSANRNITVSANYNDIVVLVQLTDNAGNVSYDYYQFGIDKTSPSVSATFNDLSNAQNGSYYREKRTLTVTVKERDFTHSGKSVIFTYKYQGETNSYIIDSNKFKAIDSAPIYNDSKSYTFTIDKFTQDGEYADFKFEIEDRVGNSTNADKSVIRSNNNNMFRYDHIAPVITIASDRHGQNSNTKFYQDSRVITVTVRDRYATNSKAQSYIVRRVNNLTDFSFADSEANQRYHTASRTLTYTFTFRTNTSIDCALLLNTISDLAGNRVSNVPNIANGADFVIDGRIPQSFSATITEDGESGVNVLNQSDYKVFVGDDITLTITCEDENLRYANISDVRLVCAALTSSGRTEEHVFELNKVSSQSSRNRITYSINNLDYDGFYDLSFTVTDDSGKQSSVQNIRFALSRNGALFASKDIESIQNHGAYNINSISDIAFNQYSAQRNTKATLYISSKNGSLGFKGRTLVEGVDYVINGGNLLDSDLNCYRSIYRLTKNAFMMDDGRILDGVYLITITPDNTSSENGQRSVNAQSTSFEVTIDATNPVISDVNTSYTTSYGSDENYEFKQDDNKTLFTDTINLEFNVSDTFSGINENTVSVTWGEETEKRQVTKNENGNYSIKLNSDDAQNGNVVNISVEDKAGNSINYSFELNLNNNFWIYIVIAAFCLIALIIVIVLVIKSKKPKKD